MESPDQKPPPSLANWTEARIIEYVAKLVLFTLIPGLHQIAYRHRIFGGLMLALFLGSQFTILRNVSITLAEDKLMLDLLNGLSILLLVFSGLLLAIDVKHLRDRSLAPGLLTALVFWAALHAIPPPAEPGTLVMKQSVHDLCPAYCEGDFVEYKLRIRGEEEFSVGDYVVLKVRKKPVWLSRILAVPPKKIACDMADQDPAAKKPEKDTIDPESETIEPEHWSHVPQFEYDRDGYAYKPPQDIPVWNKEGYYCDFGVRVYPYQYLGSGGVKFGYKMPSGPWLSLVLDQEIKGLGLRKIGSGHKSFSPRLNDRLDQIFVTIYRWTGLNLFSSPSEKST